MGKLAPLFGHTEMMARIIPKLVIDLENDWIESVRKDQQQTEFTPEDDFFIDLEIHINAFIGEMVRVLLEVPKSGRKRTQETLKAIIRSANKMTGLLKNLNGPVSNWNGIKVALPRDANDIPHQLVVILGALKRGGPNRKICDSARKLAGLLSEPEPADLLGESSVAEHAKGRKVAVDLLRAGMAGWGIFGDDHYTWEMRDSQYKELQRTPCSPALSARHYREFFQSDWSKTRLVKLDKSQLIAVFLNLKQTSTIHLEAVGDSLEDEARKVARFRAATEREDLPPFTPDLDKAKNISPEGKVYDTFADNLVQLYKWQGGWPNTGHPQGDATPFVRFVKMVEDILPEEIHLKTYSLASRAKKVIRK